MQRKTVYATAIVLMLSIVPAVSAVSPWMVAGSFEPDTAYDTSTWMWQDSPPPGSKRVYFNVVTFGSDPGLGVSSYNPNVAAAQTRNEAATGEFHEAVLGLWSDCNGDGYIGNAETALREYPSELLPVGSPCAPKSGTPNSGWTLEKGHNYNGIVTELIPISRGATLRDARVLRDDAARVWGDFDRPDAAQEHRRCAMRPFPRGTLATTGGALDYVDCGNGIIANFNAAMDAAGDPAGLRFADDEDASSGTLGQQRIFGSEDDQHAAVRVADCRSDPTLRSGDLINSTPPAVADATKDSDGGGAAHEIYVRPVAPAQANQDPTQWTIPGQLNATNEETTGDCDASNDAGQDFYGTGPVESDNPQIDPKDKRGANWNFYFFEANRGGAPVSVIVGRGPGSAGMNEADAGAGWGGSRWIADSAWGKKPGPSLVKADLQNGQVGPPDAYHLSFFAFVGGNTTSRGLLLPGGGSTVDYGRWTCGAQTSGVSLHGWNCDSSTWYKNPDGSEQSGFSELDRTEFVLLDQPYNLRDVDCYDGNSGPGIPLGAAAFGAEPCVPAS